jgi:magnesium transporter
MTADHEPRFQLRDLELALSRGPVELARILEEVHPADLAEWMDELEDEDAVRVFEVLDVESQAELLDFAEDSVAKALIDAVPVPRLVEIVEELPADEVADLLALASEEKSEEVLRHVDVERAKGLRELLAFDAESAGGVMTSEYVAIPRGTNVGDAIKEIRSEEGPAGEEEVGVFVVDDGGRPVGFVSDRELLTTPIHTPIEEVMETDLVMTSAEEDQEEAANLVAKYNLSALPVVDEAGVLIGVISAEDAHDVLQDEVEEDIYRLVGTSTEDPTRLPVLVRVRHRLPLQALTVLGGIFTAWILDLALPSKNGGEGTVDILRYLPLIIGLAGNVGVQSSTILVRAFATGEVSPDREMSVLGSEVLTGFVIGLLCGLATTAFILGGDAAWGGTGGSARFAISVGFAIAVAVSWAAFLGCTVPILCQRWGIDPAIVAGPFLITLSDISGAAIFVGVAGMMTVGLSG